MPDREQQLIEAAMRYLQLLEGDRLISIGEYVATVDPELREELAPYLEYVLAMGELEAPAALSAEDQALADRAAARTRERLGQHIAEPGAGTLTEARKARKLSIGALAQQLNLPPDLLARIERGGVQVTTIPHRLIERLASALGRAETEIQALLQGSQMAPAGVRLSAKDGTVVPPEEVVSFAEALQASGATAAQRREWG